MNTNEILIALLTSELMGRAVDERIKAELSEEKIAELYSLSKHHDLAHIVAAALDKAGILKEGEIFSLFKNERMVAVFRYRRLVDELSRLSEFFENEKIEHIALKGSYLREFYPEPWMRTSCDVDILVKKEEIDRAKAFLEEKMGYKLVARTGHDISFDSPTGVHLELHFTLIDEGTFGSSEERLYSVWEYTSLVDGKSFTFVISDEFFYLYHIVHMAKHFMVGGCGIKSILDHWVLNNRVPHDKEKRRAFLEKSEFAVFEEKITQLTRVWFEGAEKDPLSVSLEEFILTGGVYGTVQNSVSVGVVRKKSRFSYALSRIFPPHKTMVRIYPSLEKHKILLPFYHIRRWCRVVFKGGVKKASAELSKSNAISEEEIKNTEFLLTGLGLKKN